REKAVPLWNPYSAFGTPLAADMISQPFYPPSALLSLHPSMQAYDLFIIFRLFPAGFFTYLFLRLFVNRASSLFGSISFMFTGYFIVYLNMQHLSVEVLLPAVFYFFEIMLRKGSSKSLAWAGLAVFLTIAGGMPESAFLVLTFGYFYYLFRLFSEPSFATRKRLHLQNLILANVLGFALCAVQLVPFCEFMAHSYDTHQPANLGGAIRGTEHDTCFPSVLIYLVPMIFGDVFNPVFPEKPGITGYWGVLPFLFAVLGILAFFRLKKSACTGGANRMVIFFSCAALIIVMKRFGFVLINWTGRLPLADMVYFPKYLEPLLGFAIAVLSGFGFSALSAEELKRKYFLPSLAVTACVVFGLTAYWLPAIVQIKYMLFSFLNIASAALLLAFAAFVHLAGRKGNPACRLPLIFTAALSAELFSNFIIPSFYSLNKLPDQNADPYAGAPYIEFLQENNTGNFRVFGRENVLYPNWAGVFGLCDVRSLNAMTFNRYVYFVRNFLAQDGEGRIPYGAGLTDRFTGSEDEYSFSTLPEKRFLQLSSVKYLLCASPFEQPAGSQSSPGRAAVPYKMIYDKEIMIYEVPDILPRASVFYRAELMGRDDCILARLKDPSLDIKKSVLVFSGDLNGNEKALIEDINNSPLKEAHGAEILSYRSQKVEIRAVLQQTGILVLNDTFYPGWKVYVNGRETALLNVNYLFRGVPLKEGDHLVEFRYEPSTFRLGLLISAVSLTATAALLLRYDCGH
ncbi:MAG TPA: YfhO family protein, partial [Bacillota bacterium]|nr:YfhO family protein [Bacillota bacterium]